LAGLSGRVVEVGAGNGLNFVHYPEAVSEVVAVEPESYLRGHAAEAAAGAAVSVRVVGGVAERLPLGDSSVDAGVASLVLCSVPDQDTALQELLRVIRPGGQLRFYEHVVSRKGRAARIQGAADATFWPTVGGGCHMARNTGRAIERAGFVVEHCERFSFAPAPLLSLPHIRGVARRP
jgi:ubiquinone/menaquinone biosynthesis C-methylase UbiE